MAVPEAPCFLPELPVEAALADEPGCQPLDSFGSAEDSVASLLGDGFLEGLNCPGDAPPWRASVRDFLRAYASSSVTPTQAMERLIEFLKRSETRSPPCAWLISWSPEEVLRQARESTERYASRMARPLEGVPFAVKDVADALPYPTTAGTSFMAGRCATSFLHLVIHYSGASMLACSASPTCTVRLVGKARAPPHLQAVP